MERGEIWQIVLPISSGREQVGARPAIVVQDSVYGEGSPLVLAVPFTPQEDVIRFPATVLVEPTESNGLSKTSIAMEFQIRAVDRTRFTREIGILSDEELAVVLDALNKLTGQ